MVISLLTFSSVTRTSDLCWVHFVVVFFYFYFLKKENINSCDMMHKYLFMTFFLITYFIFSSPLGELFDHGLDSSAAFLMAISLFSLFGHGPHSVTLWELHCILLACLLGFYTAHWEKYNTGTLFLPWTYDASQLVRLLTSVVVRFDWYCIIHLQ